jgi:hypothetical protein
MKVTMIVVIAAEKFPGKAGGGDAFRMSVSGRRAPIRTRHGVTSNLAPPRDARKKKGEQPQMYFADIV